LRNSALTAPSQVAWNCPALTNGDAARPAGTKSEMPWATLRSVAPPVADFTDRISPASGFCSAAVATKVNQKDGSRSVRKRCQFRKNWYSKIKPQRHEERRASAEEALRSSCLCGLSRRPDFIR